MHSENELRLLSLDELQQIPLFATIIGSQDRAHFPLMWRDREPVPNPEWCEHVGAILPDELPAISNTHRKQIFQGRVVDSVHWLPTGHLAIRWRKDAVGIFGGPQYQPSYLAELPDSFTVGFTIHPTGDSHVLKSILLNSKNPFVQWLVCVKKASNERASGLLPETYERLYDMFHESCDALYKLAKLVEYIEKWQEMPELPSNLQPPKSSLSPLMFIRVPDPEKLARAVTEG